MSNAIVSSFANVFGGVGGKLQKHSPEILMGLGIVGTVATTVVACKATVKVNDILEDSKETIDKIHGAVDGTLATTEEYTEKDAQKDLSIVYIQTGWKLAKLYAPAIGLGVLSIGCMLTSHGIMKKRNIALAAAYTAIDSSFKDYRKRVVERFGQAVDRELKYNLKAQKITETVTDEDGKEKKVKKDAMVLEDPSSYSDYARFFDDGCENWEKDAEMNLMFLNAQQRYANELLISHGQLFLNEVYDMLGIPRTKAGQVVGWIYDPEHKLEGERDNYVDFGIFDIYRQTKRDFVNGYENVILLDFNVDGNIWDLI